MPDIRPLVERDLPQARQIFQLAFGTFLGAPDPENFWTDRDLVYGRFGAEHTASFAAEHEGALVGSNFATRWGSVGFFGPVSIRPDLWNSGIGQRLVAASCEAFEEWGIRHAGLFTFPHSAKHVGLYGKFGFHPRFLTAIMAAPARSSGAAARFSRYAELPEGQRHETLALIRNLTDELYGGLDLGPEIRTVFARKLGDTVLVWEGDSRLAGFAICHWGPASEAGDGCCFVKFGAVRPGPGPRTALPRCSMPAAASRWQPACRTCWPGSIWRARRPTGTCSGAGFAPRSRASRCTGPTSPATAGPDFSSSTIGDRKTA